MLTIKRGEEGMNVMMKTYRVALVGNPNSGKTTLFNALTGSNQHVGNWPGVTVEKKEGKIRQSNDVILVDLPGIYSLSPYTQEERIARDYLISQRPDAIINIVDVSNLERNLYLTTQMLELGIPMVIAANMMDLVAKRGDSFNADNLSKFFDCPVVEISALQEKNIEQLVERVEHQVQKPNPSTFTLPLNPVVNHWLNNIEQELKGGCFVDLKKPPYSALPLRWVSIKIFEQDSLLQNKINLNDDELSTLLEVEDALDDDGQSIISSARYDYIADIMKQIYVKKTVDTISISDKIDKVVTHRFLALPIFVAVMFVVYFVSISTIGTFMTDFVNDVVVGEWAQEGSRKLLESIGTSPWLVSLVSDGIIAGVGAVIGFLPQMATLFIMLAILEQCGYMARIAFVLDRVFRKFGLSGKSFIPMLIGTGCSVPGIMASRTIEHEADRRMTAISCSFMPCSAKLPIIAFVAGAIFNGGWWFAPLTYFMGIGSVILTGIVLKKTKRFSGDPAPFIMELPEYRLPSIKGVAQAVGERLASFIRKAGTIILLSSMAIWFLQTYGWTGQGIGEVEINQSFLAKIGNALAWIFIPLGFGDWQSTVATFTGLLAKENVMTTFAIIFGVQGDILGLIEEGSWSTLSVVTSHYTVITGFSFLAFNLLCAPCFAAIGAMHRELGSASWTLFGVFYQTLYAYSFSLIFYQLATFLSGGVFSFWTGVAIAVLLVWLYLIFRPQPGRRVPSIGVQPAFRA
jgi:ferrous iron transport protein B